MTTLPTALVLGAYGFIGAACVDVLMQSGFVVRGAGRDPYQARRSRISDWVIGDLTRFSPADWDAALRGVDVVVNAAGALQDGARDDLAAIHITLARSLAGAATRAGCAIVQISALGADPDAGSAFLATKGAGDKIIADSPTRHVILRPGLVIGQHAYGGTALLRMVAAQPLVGFVAYPDAQVQVIGMDDLAQDVVAAAKGTIPSGTVLDLCASGVHDLKSVAIALRRWLGFPPWHAVVRVPDLLAKGLAKAGDALGWLGWRPALRSTALDVLRDGILATGTGSAALDGQGQQISDLDEILASMAPHPHDRLHARLTLLLPVALALLSAFWIMSGLIGAARADRAAQILTDAGMSQGLALTCVAAGSVADIGLGLLLLLRRFARHAALGMVALSLIYLAAGTILAPALWADPMGPFLKVLPGILAALFTAAMLEGRR